LVIGRSILAPIPSRIRIATTSAGQRARLGASETCLREAQSAKAWGFSQAGLTWLNSRSRGPVLDFVAWGHESNQGVENAHTSTCRDDGLTPFPIDSALNRNSNCRSPIDDARVGRCQGICRVIIRNSHRNEDRRLRWLG
jgi:hypothetical protein